jgi:hypothetical protein
VDKGIPERGAFVGIGVVDELSECINGEEIRILRAKFSSGVTLKELGSVGVLLSSLLDIAPPPRPARRSYVLLLKWFKERWSHILPILPFIQLRDDNDVPIDGQRELLDLLLK